MCLVRKPVNLLDFRGNSTCHESICDYGLADTLSATASIFISIERHLSAVYRGCVRQDVPTLTQAGAHDGLCPSRSSWHGPWPLQALSRGWSVVPSIVYGSRSEHSKATIEFFAKVAAPEVFVPIETKSPPERSTLIGDIVLRFCANNQCGTVQPK